jgi:ABC-type uncharacterized transport system permease subunit
MNHPFTVIGATVNLSVTTTTGSVALTTIGDQGGMEVRLYNAGSATVFVNFGISTVAATTAAGFPLPSGAIEIFTVGPVVTHVAALTAAGTATLYATSGRGI